MTKIFMFGGTFDPIHFGHIKTIENIYKRYTPDRFLIVPCKEPILKAKSRATASQRIAMIESALDALKPSSAFSIETYELEKSGPSYSFDTLTHLKNVYGQDATITMIVGQDAFMQLDKWYQWKSIIDCANILILTRPDCTFILPDALQSWYTQHVQPKSMALSDSPSGSIVLENFGEYAVSSTQIRKHIAMQSDISPFCPPDVINYIKSHQLYR
jgi:nicotinate-nucleotide adenylyltransferase